MKLLITDLDNTLYDWVTFYSKSFEAMVNALSKEIGVPLDILLAEYKSIHQKFGNSEKPFATLELPSVLNFFKSDDKKYLQKQLSPVLSAFSSKRNDTLKLYPGVKDTLDKLNSEGVKIVAHTEALEFNSLYRLNKLGIVDNFVHLYTLEDRYNIHPDPPNAKAIPVDGNFIIRLPPEESKPNPELLRHICREEKVDVKDAVYVGDSLTKDISMANEVGIKSVWANYGRNFSPECWKILVQITHWTDEDVAREEELKKTYANIKPDYTIENFSELLSLG
ncbi:HAD-IA family hydrolase [Agarivorans sp. B2Z047]|uniref:HAD family hydrolase n=1 Tax=Agarivorans sp. B2Z047 TaxID=2652721 RepID=UPI00128DAD95|nr:HAD-IA family hydrolase [Agarivorans sp. B2Z047]MPW27808.1 HAD-IA family hydrolase [Agarivorans sp. B2Z047]UQN44357.1 HAD-IA family hydrolase [Agarivorans sp. B2Z047]